MDGELKLTIELVPSTSWYINLRTRVPRRVWDRIRRQAYAASGFRCSVCGARGVRLHCHEVWDYDDDQRVQRLAGFVVLCAMCHWVKHIGLAGIMADEGRLDYEAVVRHFMKVNGCDRSAFEEHAMRAFAQWNERSRAPWTVDFGPYRDLIDPRR